MNTETVNRKILNLAHEVHEVTLHQQRMKLTADVLGVLYQILETNQPNGWHKIDKVFRQHFPEMYEKIGFAKTRYLSHYKKIFNQGSWILVQMSPEEISALYAPSTGNPALSARSGLTKADNHH